MQKIKDLEAREELEKEEEAIEDEAFLNAANMLNGVRLEET
jgi:hypothetical protein